MEGHGDTATHDVAEAPVDSLSPEQLAIGAQKAAALAVEALEPVILQLGETVRSVAGRVDLLETRAKVDEPESRLDSIEARLNAFGLGGETVGDALALAHFALSTARAIAAAVERSQGVAIPLPPAPLLAAQGEAVVKGAELAESLSL